MAAGVVERLGLYAGFSVGTEEPVSSGVGLHGQLFTPWDSAYSVLAVCWYQLPPYFNAAIRIQYFDSVR